MEGKMDKKIKGWQKLLSLLFIIPCIMLCIGCKGSNTQANTSNLTCQVIFYTGFPDKFNLPSIDVKEGQKIKEPINFPNVYQSDSGVLYQLIGWYSDQSMTDEYYWSFQSDVGRSSMTLYARWEEI